jgi:hypothetical protein
MMNAQPANGKNRGRPIEGDEPFMPRTLLSYAAPPPANVRGPIRLLRLVGDPPSYGASTINILQNNYYHELEHEDPHDCI